RNGLAGNAVLSLLADGGNLYVGLGGTQKALALSTNQGKTWNYPDTGLKMFEVRGIIRSGTNLIAGGFPNDAKYGFYKSTNEGLSWDVCPVSSRWDGCTPSRMLKVGTTLIASTNASPYVSHDGGLNWNVTEY